MLNAHEVNQTANDIMVDPVASYWLKDAVRALERRDPVDAYLDASRLFECFRARLQALHGAHKAGKPAEGLSGRIPSPRKLPTCYREDK